MPCTAARQLKVKEFDVCLIYWTLFRFPRFYCLSILRVQDIVKVKSTLFLQDIKQTFFGLIVFLLPLALSAELEPGVDDLLIGLPDFADNKGMKDMNGCVFSFSLFGVFRTSSSEGLSSFLRGDRSFYNFVVVHTYVFEMSIFVILAEIASPQMLLHSRHDRFTNRL